MIVLTILGWAWLVFIVGYAMLFRIAREVFRSRGEIVAWDRRRNARNAAAGRARTAAALQRMNDSRARREEHRL